MRRPLARCRRGGRRGGHPACACGSRRELRPAVTSRAVLAWRTGKKTRVALAPFKAFLCTAWRHLGRSFYRLTLALTKRTSFDRRNQLLWVLLPITLLNLCRLEDSHGTAAAALLALAAPPPVLADTGAAAVLAPAAIPPVLAKSAGAALLAIAAPPPVLTDVATAALLAPAAPPPMLAELAATALFAQAAIPPVLAYAAAAAILAPAARPPVLALSHSTFARTTRSGAVLAKPRSQQHARICCFAFLARKSTGPGSTWSYPTACGVCIRANTDGLIVVVAAQQLHKSGCNRYS